MNSFNQTNISIIPIFVFRKYSKWYEIFSNRILHKFSILTMSKNESLLYTLAFYILYFFFDFLFVIFFRLSSSKRKEFCYYITWIHFFTGNNIDIVVVQGDTTHKKILSWASHILRTYHLFYYFINFIYAGLFFISYNG